MKVNEFREQSSCVKCKYPLSIFQSDGPRFYFDCLCEGCQDKFESGHDCHKCGGTIIDSVCMGCGNVWNGEIEASQNYLKYREFIFYFDEMISYWIRETCRGDLRVKLQSGTIATVCIFGKEAYEFDKIWMEYKSPIPSHSDKIKKEITLEMIHEKLESIEAILRSKE